MHPAGGDRLRLQRVHEEGAGEQRDQRQHVQVHAVGARQVGNACAGRVGRLQRHAGRQRKLGCQRLGACAGGQLQVDAGDAPEPVEPPLRKPDVHDRHHLAFAGARQRAGDGQRLRRRAGLQRQRVADPQVEGRQRRGRQVQAIVEQREAPVVARRRLAEPGGRQRSGAQHVNAHHRQTASAQPGRLDDRRFDLQHRTGQRHARIGGHTREHRVAEALARADDRRIGLSRHLTYRGRKLGQRRRVDQMDRIAERHADGNRQ